MEDYRDDIGRRLLDLRADMLRDYENNETDNGTKSAPLRRAFESLPFALELANITGLCLLAAAIILKGCHAFEDARMHKEAFVNSSHQLERQSYTDQPSYSEKANAEKRVLWAGRWLNSSDH
jgi:hypothetical protein